MLMSARFCFSAVCAPRNDTPLISFSLYLAGICRRFAAVLPLCFYSAFSSITISSLLIFVLYLWAFLFVWAALISSSEWSYFTLLLSHFIALCWFIRLQTDTAARLLALHSIFSVTCLSSLLFVSSFCPFTPHPSHLIAFSVPAVFCHLVSVFPPSAHLCSKSFSPSPSCVWLENTSRGFFCAKVSTSDSLVSPGETCSHRVDRSQADSHTRVTDGCSSNHPGK